MSCELHALSARLALSWPNLEHPTEQKMSYQDNGWHILSGFSIRLFHEKIIRSTSMIPVQESVFHLVTSRCWATLSQAHSIHRFFVIVIDVQQLIGKRPQDLEEIPFGFRITPNDFNGFTWLDFPKCLRNV